MLPERKYAMIDKIYTEKLTVFEWIRIFLIIFLIMFKIGITFGWF